MKPVILVVDDDPQFLALAERLLSKKHWEIKSVGDAESAIAFMKLSKPHVLVTDLEMPGKNGLDLTVHTVTSFPELPVVILTGRGDERTAIESFRLGAADYVRKESVHDELVSCVGKLLKEERQVEATIQRDAAAAQPIRIISKQSPLTIRKDRPQKHAQRLELEKEFIIRHWGNNVSSGSLLKGPDRELCEPRLRVFRRQAERLEKWSALSDGMVNKRRGPRFPFADVVHLIPVNRSGVVQIENRFVAFCRNLSESGCSILRNGLLREKKWAIFFPHQRPIETGNCCRVATLVRDKPIPLGMYEMGFLFEGAIDLCPEDVVVMLSKKTSLDPKQKFPRQAT